MQWLLPFSGLFGDSNSLVVGETRFVVILLNIMTKLMKDSFIVKRYYASWVSRAHVRPDYANAELQGLFTTNGRITIYLYVRSCSKWGISIKHPLGNLRINNKLTNRETWCKLYFIIDLNLFQFFCSFHDCICTCFLLHESLGKILYVDPDLEKFFWFENFFGHNGHEIIPPSASACLVFLWWNIDFSSQNAAPSSGQRAFTSILIE